MPNVSANAIGFGFNLGSPVYAGDPSDDGMGWLDAGDGTDDAAPDDGSSAPGYVGADDAVDAADSASGNIEYVGLNPDFVGLGDFGASGDTLRITIGYRGIASQLWSALGVFSTWQSFADGVGTYDNRIRMVSQMTVFPVDQTEVASDDDVCVVDCLVKPSPKNMTVRQFIAAVDSVPHISAEIRRVQRVPATNDAARQASLKQAKINAHSSVPNGGGGAGGVRIVRAPSPPAPSFGGELGKYLGVVLGLAALVAVAYYVRAVKD